MATLADKFLKNPRAYLPEADNPISGMPPVKPGDDANAAAPQPAPDAPPADAPKDTSPTGIQMHLDPLKELAKKDLAVIQHLVNLKRAYLEDPHLGGDDAQVSMVAILQHLFRKDERAAYFFGRVLFEPDVNAFIALFDDIGAQKLGPYLGINNLDDIPAGKGDQGFATEFAKTGGDVPATPPPGEPAPGTPAPEEGESAPNLPKI